MEATGKRNIQNGIQYDYLFPAASGAMNTVRKDATVGDTVSFIKKVVPETIDQTRNIAVALKGRSVYDTCKNIWHFVYSHIAYKKDEDGYEQIRSPARSWRDRKSGVDCDCYSTFISSILTNLGIPHILRITKYQKDYFQHIYPIVPDGGRTITIDCVTDRFDYEVPYSEKKDTHMDLQFLNGLGRPMPYSSVDDQIIDGYDEVGELGLFGKRKKKQQAAITADAMANPNAVPPSGGKKKKGFFKKLLNVANKVNPATVALRNGILVAMKLNIGKIGSRLRWSYLTPNAAKAKGMDMERFASLVRTRQKLESIFFNAGGNPNNMKKAILKGKGNKDHAVNGLLGLGAIEPDRNIDNMNIHTSIQELLGDIYYDENVRDTDGYYALGDLGEPVTIATVAAASSVIAAIAASLKKIGDVFKGKKTEGSEDFSEEATATADKDVVAVKDAAPAAASNPATAEAAATFNTTDETTTSSSQTAVARSASTDTDEDMSTDTSPTSADTAIAPTGTSLVADSVNTSSSKVASKSTGGFWENNKKWIIPVGLGVAVVGVGMKMMSHPPVKPSRGKQLDGLAKVTNKRGKSKNKKKQKPRGRHKVPVALL
jgi:hypothetical protein